MPVQDTVAPKAPKRDRAITIMVYSDQTLGMGVGDIKNPKVSLDSW